MSIEGKIVARIEEGPTDRELGYRRHDTLLVHFTDGTALEVSGSSYEEVSLGWDERDRDDVAAYVRAAAGRREKERLERLKRDTWLSLTCGQRAERKAAKDAKLGAFALAVQGMERDMVMDMVRSVHSPLLFGEGWDPAETVKGFCERCGERSCENAPDVPLYPERSGPFFKAGEIEIPLKPQDAG